MKTNLTSMKCDYFRATYKENKIIHVIISVTNRIVKQKLETTEEE